MTAVKYSYILANMPDKQNSVVVFLLPACHSWLSCVISHYKTIGYNIDALQQTAYLVVNPITAGNFAFQFYCTPLGRT